MVSFGKWLMGDWHEATIHYNRVETADKNWHYQALQELRRHKDGLTSMRRLMSKRGLDNVFRLTDVEILELIADRLKSGEFCLFEYRRMTLSELREAAFETPVGQEFIEEILQAGRKEPEVVWGKAEYRSTYVLDSNRIFLHQHFLKDNGLELSDREWVQAIVGELGNAMNELKFEQMLAAAVIDLPSRDAFTEAIEKREYETRMRIVKAFNDGEFCKPPGSMGCLALFDRSIITFAQFLRDPRVQQHRNRFAFVWDRHCRMRYEQKQKSKQPPTPAP